MSKTANNSAHAALKAHAAGRDTIEFTQEVRQGTIRFFKGTVARFEDPAVAAFLDVAFNGTEFSDKEPVVTISNDELNFDPEAPGDTIDPHTVIGRGRAGIVAGITVHDHLTGGASSGDATLQAHDSVAGSKG